MSGASTNACGISNATATITILPQLVITASDVNLCVGSTSIALNATNNYPTNLQSQITYNWYSTTTGFVGSGNPLTLTQITSGVYYVEAIVQSTNCQYYSNNFNVNVLPAPAITLVGSASQCAGNIQTYSVSGFTTGMTANWTVTGGTFAGSGSSISVNWTNMPITGGIVSVSINTVGATNCQATTSITVLPCCSFPASGLRASGYGATASTPFLTSTLGATTISPSGGNNIVTLDGFILVDNNITFNNLEVQLGPNAKIEVVNGKTFTIQNNCLFKARCGQMWDGIYVNGVIAQNQPPTQMGIVDIHNNCTIQDAKNAIVSARGGVYRIYDHITFNKNYKHIVVSNCTNSITLNFPHTSYVRENTLFTCKQLTTTGSTLITPYAGSITNVAIEITNVDNINIGNPTINGKNIFENCNIGIYNIRSSIVVKNNEFLNTSRTQAIGYNCACAVGTAICSRGYTTGNAVSLRTDAIGGIGTNEANEIHNVQYGIDIKRNTNAAIVGNTIYAIPSFGIKVYDNGVDNTIGHNITDNDMYNVLFNFIDLNNNNACPKVISNNHINQAVPATVLTGSNYLATAIQVSENSNSPTSANSKCIMQNNFINAVQRGIYCNLVANLDITSLNKIYPNAANYSGNANCYGYGIKLTSCRNNKVINNTVAAANRWNWWVSGIQIEACINNVIQCNAIGHVGYGLRFEGTNYLTASLTPATAYTKNKIYNNRLHDCVVALAYTNGAVGDLKEVSSSNVTQGADNFWTGTYDGVSTFHTFMYSNYSQTSWPIANLALNNKIYVRNTLGSVFNPNPMYWKADYVGGPQSGFATQNAIASSIYGYTTNNFNYSEVATGANVSCNNGDLNTTNNLDAAVSLAALANYATAYNVSIEEAAEWWKKYNYYVELKDKPEEIDTPEKQDFVNTLNDEAIGKLEEIRHRMNDSLTNDSLGLIDSKNLNTAIVPSNDMEQKLKEVNEYYLRLLIANGKEDISFDAIDETTMRTLAELCPSIYGPGVYAIRSIMARIDTVPTAYSSPCEAMIDPNGSNLGNARRGTIIPKVREAGEPDFTELDESGEHELVNKPNVGLFDVKCYPNPAGNSLNIEGNFSAKSLVRYEVYNAVGSIIENGILMSEQTNSINTESMSNGFYLIKVFDNDKNVSNLKVTIQH